MSPRPSGGSCLYSESGTSRSRAFAKLAPSGRREASRRRRGAPDRPPTYLRARLASSRTWSQTPPNSTGTGRPCPPLCSGHLMRPQALGSQDPSPCLCHPRCLLDGSPRTVTFGESLAKIRRRTVWTAASPNALTTHLALYHKNTQSIGAPTFWSCTLRKRAHEPRRTEYAVITSVWSLQGTFFRPFFVTLETRSTAGAHFPKFDGRSPRATKRTGSRRSRQLGHRTDGPRWPVRPLCNGGGIGSWVSSLLSPPWCCSV